MLALIGLSAHKKQDGAHSRHIVASAWTDGSKALSISAKSRSVSSIGAENVSASMWPLRTVGYRHSAFATVREPIQTRRQRLRLAGAMAALIAIADAIDFELESPDRDAGSRFRYQAAEDGIALTPS